MNNTIIEALIPIRSQAVYDACAVNPILKADIDEKLQAFRSLDFSEAVEVRTYYLKHTGSDAGYMLARYEIPDAPEALRTGLMIEAVFDMNEGIAELEHNRVIVCTASELKKIEASLQSKYYYFDTPDAVIGDHYFSISELMTFTGSDSIEETDIIRLAKNYEASLSRYTRDPEGNYTLDAVLYEIE